MRTGTTPARRGTGHAACPVPAAAPPASASPGTPATASTAPVWGRGRDRRVPPGCPALADPHPPHAQTWMSVPKTHVTQPPPATTRRAPSPAGASLVTRAMASSARTVRLPGSLSRRLCLRWLPPSSLCCCFGSRGSRREHAVADPLPARAAVPAGGAAGTLARGRRARAPVRRGRPVPAPAMPRQHRVLLVRGRRGAGDRRHADGAGQHAASLREPRSVLGGARGAVPSL